MIFQLHDRVISRTGLKGAVVWECSNPAVFDYPNVKIRWEDGKTYVTDKNTGRPIYAPQWRVNNKAGSKTHLDYAVLAVVRNQQIIHIVKMTNDFAEEIAKAKDHMQHYIARQNHTVAAWQYII